MCVGLSVNEFISQEEARNPDRAQARRGSQGHENLKSIFASFAFLLQVSPKDRSWGLVCLAPSGRLGLRHRRAVEARGQILEALRSLREVDRS